jgi:hypothetical protein
MLSTASSLTRSFVRTPVATAPITEPMYSMVAKDNLIGGFLGWVRQIAVGVLDGRWNVSRQTIEVGFAGRMVNHRPIACLRTSCRSRIAPAPTENTRDEISYRAKCFHDILHDIRTCFAVARAENRFGPGNSGSEGATFMPWRSFAGVHSTTSQTAVCTEIEVEF